MEGLQLSRRELLAYWFLLVFSSGAGSPAAAKPGYQPEGRETRTVSIPSEGSSALLRGVSSRIVRTMSRSSPCSPRGCPWRLPNLQLKQRSPFAAINWPYNLHICCVYVYLFPGNSRKSFYSHIPIRLINHNNYYDYYYMVKFVDL